MHRYFATALIAVVAFLLGATINSSRPSQAAMGQSGGQIFRAGQLFAGSLKEITPGVWVKPLGQVSQADMAAVEISSVARHTHNNSSEFVYVVSGTAQVTLGSRSATVYGGDVLLLPKGTPHSVRAVGAKVKLLAVEAPPLAANDMHMMK